MVFTVKALGSNGGGQLGVGHLEDLSHPAECIFVDSKPSSRPVRIAAGGNHTLLLCEDGSVYATGNNDNGRCGITTPHPTLTNFHRVSFNDKDGNVVQNFLFIAATWEASTFVATDGRIFSAGTGAFGELGQGKDVTQSHIPREVSKFSPGSDIVDVAASMRHSVVILANGHVYGWGAARKGQLGVPYQKAVFEPRKLSAPPKDDVQESSFFVKSVICCRDFSCLVDASAANSQFVVLGSDSTGNLRDQQFYCIGKWKRVAASWSGVFALDDDHNLMGWGKNWIPSVKSSKIKPIAIAAGSEHVLAEMPDSRILAVGWGEHGNCGKPTDETGIVKDRWNDIGTGHILGAGCATSFIFND